MTQLSHNRLAVAALMVILIFGCCSSLLFVEGSGRYGYSYSTLDISGRGISPLDDQSHLSHRHLLGTDKLGRDTLAGIGNGIKIAAYLSVLSVGLALLIGIVMSVLSTFHLFTQVRVSPPLYWISVLGLWYSLYLLTYVVLDLEVDFTYVTIGLSLISAGVYIASRKWNSSLTADQMILKIIELWRTLPSLLILLIIASMVQTMTYTTLSCMIAILIWPSFARLLRGEIIKLSSLPYIKSAIASGASLRVLYLRHLLPNAMAPVIAHLCFAMVSVILLEATLSFLGIGIPYDQVSLGGMIKASTDQIAYWWLAVFPGMILVVLLISLNKIGTSILQ